MFRPSLSLLALALGLSLFPGTARATEFTITITNPTSTAAGNAQTWSTGLLTTVKPLMAIGAAPTASSPFYPTYQFISASCNTGTDDGDVTTLASRMSLTLGGTLPTSVAINSLGPGQTQTVTINATAPARLYYIARVNTFTDDFVSIHESGAANINTLSVPLFDSVGMPIAPVVFDMAGYDVATSTQGNGAGGACSAVCPPPATGCWVAPGNGTPGGGTFGGQTAQPTLTNAWNYPTTGFTTDGIALADVAGTSSSAKELVVVAEAGQYNAAFDKKARGRTYILGNLNGSSPSATFFATATDGHDLMGIPLVEDLTSTAASPTTPGHYVVGETVPAASGGAVYVRNFTGALYTPPGLGYPGFWNMGASTGNVRNDAAAPGNELIIPTWTGDLLVLRNTTGAQLNFVSLFAAPLNENLYGHVAIGDVMGTGLNYIVALGAATGKTYVLQAGTSGAPAGGISVAWKSTAPGGLYAFGSGPAIANLDGQARNEIIVASAGSNKVYAYDPVYSAAGGCKYQWTVTGATDFAWSSPVVGDVDGDGVKDIVVMSSNSLLAVLKVPATPTSGCATGTVSYSHTVGNGGSAWFTPALGDLTGTGALDVVVANYNTLEVLDVQAKKIAFRFNDPSANFYPSAVIERRTGTATNVPAAAIYVSSWANGKVYRLTTPNTSNVPVADWPTFMGNNQRTGAR